MNQDLQQYADIIEQLKPMVNEPEFNRVLMQVGANIPKEKRFLIKIAETHRKQHLCRATGAISDGGKVGT